MTTRRTVIKQGALGAATLATSTAMPWRMLRAQAKTGEDCRHRTAERSVGAPGHAHQVGRGNRHGRDQRERRHQVDGRREGRTCDDRCRRLGRKGEERRATSDRTGARRGWRHGRVAFDLHACDHGSDRARPAPVDHALLCGQHHRSRLQIRVPELHARRQAVDRRRCRRCWSSPRPRPERCRRLSASLATIRLHRWPSSSRCATAGYRRPG